MDPQVGESLDCLSFSFCSTLFPCISFRQKKFWTKFWEGVGVWPTLNWPFITSGYGLYCSLPFFWAFQLMSSQFCLESHLLSWHQGLSVGYPQFLTSPCYPPLINLLILCISPPSPLTLDPAPFFFSPSLFLPNPFHPVPPVTILLLLLNRSEESTLGLPTSWALHGL